MIKNITVKTKPFVVGDNFYIASAGKVKQYEVIENPKATDGIFTVLVRLIQNGEVFEFYPGDDGVPGYQYDDRPCIWGRSEITALQQRDLYAVWLYDHVGKFTNFSEYYL